MALTRREFVVRAAALFGCASTGWVAPPADPLRAAAGFFAARQSRDGAWRSDSYAAFRGGDALTPVVLWAFHTAETDMTARGLHWLEELTDSQTRRSAVVYPLFTAGYATQVFAASGDTRRAAVWADVIESLRIRAELGWPADAAACGAWGDSATPPRLPPDVSPPPDMLAPNISATVLALQALRAVGRETKQALPFIESCQNFSASEPGGFNDGGFFFTPGDPVRNKAGIAGRDSAVRYRSYGSATCDGVRSCGRASAPARRARLVARQFGRHPARWRVAARALRRARVAPLLSCAGACGGGVGFAMPRTGRRPPRAASARWIVDGPRARQLRGRTIAGDRICSACADLL